MDGSRVSRRAAIAVLAAVPFVMALPPGAGAEESDDLRDRHPGYSIIHLRPVTPLTASEHEALGALAARLTARWAARADYDGATVEHQPADDFIWLALPRSLGGRSSPLPRMVGELMMRGIGRQAEDRRVDVV